MLARDASLFMSSLFWFDIDPSFISQALCSDAMLIN